MNLVLVKCYIYADARLLTILNSPKLVMTIYNYITGLVKKHVTDRFPKEMYS